MYSAVHVSRNLLNYWPSPSFVVLPAWLVVGLDDHFASQAQSHPNWEVHMPALRPRSSLLPAFLSSHVDFHMVHPCDYSHMSSLTLKPPQIV